jgi:hypothetical protein
MNLLAYIFHIGGGTIGLASGLVAAFSRKGGNLHRKAGIVFVAAMLVMAVFAIYLAVVVPGQTVNVFIGTFALYLVSTAWMTVRRPEQVTTGIFFLPQLLVLCFLVFWMIRVRFTGWRQA